MDTLILVRLWGAMLSWIVLLFGVKPLRVVTLSILIPAVFYGIFTINHVGKMTMTMVVIFGLLLYYSIEFRVFLWTAVFVCGMLAIFLTSYVIFARSWTVNEKITTDSNVYYVVGQIIDKSQTGKESGLINRIKKFTVVGLTADAYHNDEFSEAENPGILTSPIYTDPKYAKELTLLEKYKAMESQKFAELTALRENPRSSWFKTCVSKPIAYSVREIGFCFRFAWMEFKSLFLLFGGITIGLDVPFLIFRKKRI